MDKQPTVVFRNVGQVYFPQTRVECHYSLTSNHQWSSSDWIGIFEMGWSSIKQYYTYAWALVPEGYTEGTNVNFCAHFYAFYLPRPSPVEYQFVYVDKMGEVCAQSRPFTFCAPKPLEELETLKEEQDEEDGGEELLLVIPRAQLLQSQLEDCLKKQVNLQRALDVVKSETENERENSRRVRSDWECEREAMKEEITELRDNLRHSCEMLKNIEGKHNDVKYNQENLFSELSKLTTEKEESQQQIKDLQDHIRVLTDREEETNNELERLKERLKKMSCQMKHDEEKRKSLQLENEAGLMEVRGLQERLEASDHITESLRRELRDLGARQGHTHTELHQARLQVAQLTLQLSEENLLLREERANWALEREAYKHATETDKKKLQDLSCEVQRKEEWLQEERVEREKVEVELGREKDYNKVLQKELQELRASLRRVQKEREEERHDRQQLEQRFGIVPETNCIKSTCTSPCSSSEDDEDVSSASSRLISSPVTSAESEDDSDTQDEQAPEQPILPELVSPVLKELADFPMW